MQKLRGGAWGGGGGRNFRANDFKYFLCSQGVAVVKANVSGVRDYSTQEFFPFCRWSLLDRGRKKEKRQEPTMIPSYVLHSVSGQPVAYLDFFKFRKRRPRRKRWQKWSEGCRGLFPCSVISINLYKTFLCLTWQTLCSAFLLKLLISKMGTGLEGVLATVDEEHIIRIPYRKG